MAPVAIITGAGSTEGIGYAAARRLAAAGTRLLLTSTTDRIERRAEELRGHGADAVGLVEDLTDPAASDRLVEFAVSNLGGIDILVNNAGMTSIAQPDDPAPIDQLHDTQWHASIARNLDTMFYLCRAALPFMRAARYGRIVNIASVSGPILAFRGDAGYHAAKAGVIGLTKSIALDAAADGVTANAVAPGWIATASATTHERQMGDATPIGRSGTPDEIASLIAYLTTSAASYLTGQTLIVDGGNSIMEEHG